MSSKISLRESRLGSLAALVAALGFTAPLVAAPPNDDCVSPLSIVEGTYDFDLNEATTSGIGSQCFSDFRIANDVFFCFEATVDGVVTISTCGSTLVNTRLALWAGCECPDPKFDSPICCADDECGKQAQLTCEVVCGETYMIQLGSDDPTEIGTGSFSLVMEGAPCDSSEPPIDCEECGEGDPEWLADAGFAGGQMLLFTRDAVVDGDSPILAFDLTDELSAPVGTNWAPPTWTHPDWTRTNLGTVFGVAIDDTGRSFVAHTSVFSFGGLYRDAVGALGGPGAIYALDAVTGAPTLFCQLPQTQDPSITPVAESWPGIGNIAWDFAHGSLFASNFDDGRIYRIDDSGNVIDAWDHATDTLTFGGITEPGDAPGFAPLGERVWAVCPAGDRLYYSIWVEDGFRPDAVRDNEIWSVSLDASGAIVPGTSQLEISMPALSGSYSNPVSDLDLDDACCLLTAERSMAGDSASNAHQSRGLRFCHDGDDWTLGTDYVVGFYGSGDNTAGGVAFDNGPVANTWFSADALNFPYPYLYGATGIPVAGDAPENSLLIDIDLDIEFGEKFQMGSLEISCFRDVDTGPCLEVVGELECRVDDSGLTNDYDLTLTVTNNSDNPAQYLLVTGPVDQAVTNFVPPLDPGETRDVSMVALGPIVDEVVCFSVTLYDADFDECCGLGDAQVCLVVPDCDCAIDQQWTINCVDEAAGIYEVSFNLVNLTPDVIEHVFFLTDPGVPYSFNPAHVDVPATPQFGTMSLGPIEVQTSLVPGDTISFISTLHVANLFECCGLPLEFVLPPCDDGSTSIFGDLDDDGFVGGSDLGILFANWGGSGVGDLNGDGVVDAADLGLLLTVFGG